MMNKEKNFVSAVIYIHNAENNIDIFLKTIIEVLETNFEHSEIICVNDDSHDASVVKIKEISKKAIATSVSILNMSYYHGLEIAMNAGVDLTIGDFVFEFDSTILDYDKNDIMRVYNRSLKGYDIVSASPNKRQKFSSSVFYFVFKYFTDMSYQMYTERFRILSRRVINRIGSMNKTIPYRKAIYNNCGLETDHILLDSIDCYLTTKENEQEKKYRSRLAIDTLILFTDVGYRFAITMTTLMIVTTVCMALYSIWVYLTQTPVAGWTTTILFLSFCFFGIFGILTVIIKYLQITLNLVFKRKKYNFKGIEKLTN